MHAAFLFLSNLIYAFPQVFIFPSELILQKIHEFYLFALIKYSQLLSTFQKEVSSFCDSILSFHLFFFANLTQSYYIYLLIRINLARAERILDFDKQATFIKIIHN